MDRTYAKTVFAAMALLLAASSSAATLELMLVDSNGAPAESVVVMAMPGVVTPAVTAQRVATSSAVTPAVAAQRVATSSAVTPAASAQGIATPSAATPAVATPGSSPPDPATTAAPAPAVMDQIDEQFVPQLLVVQKGTPVAFPNSDQVRHHVYSFSDAKPFELPLYRGNQHAPIAFDREGLVVLGCNIHDHMVGYILVADTPYFAVSDRDGRATLPNVPDGAYDLRVWHPGMHAPVVEYSGLTIDGTGSPMTIGVESGWKPSPSTALTWNDY